MALEDIDNHVEEAQGATRIYCANCGDPDGFDRELYDEEGNVVGTERIPPTGWAEANMVVPLGWLKVGNSLCCTPYCAAIVDGHEEETAQEIRGENWVNDPITEEQVAAMPAPIAPVELDLSALEHFGEEGV